MKTYLEERLQWYDDNYRSGNALISDAQFDQLEKNLERINPRANYFIAKNNLILPSMPKNKKEEFLDGLLNKTRIIIEPKLDGIAIGLQYQGGLLTKAINRDGKDITNKIKNVPNVPSKIKIKGLFQVRGELFVPSEYKRPSYSRRKASSYLTSEERESNHLSFCCYQIINCKINQYESLNYLKDLNFSIPENHFCNFISGIEIFRKNWVDKKLFSNYPTDGIVIKINSRKLQLLREKSLSQNNEWQYAIER